MANPIQLQIEREIVNTIEAAIEDTAIPAAIALYADRRAGKPVTVKDAKALEGQLGVPVRIKKQHGATSIAWALGKEQNPWLVEKSIQIARSETNAVWPDGERLEAEQPAYYSAARERNTARRTLLQEHKTLRDAIGVESVPEIAEQSMIYRAARAIIEMREARETLRKLFDYGEPLHVARYDMSRIVGVDVL